MILHVLFPWKIVYLFISLFNTYFFIEIFLWTLLDSGNLYMVKGWIISASIIHSLIYGD